MTAKRKPGTPGDATARGHNVVPRVQELARQNSAEALQRLIELMKSDSHYVAVDAAKAVLDRGEGRVPQRARQNRIRRRKPQELNVKIETLKGRTADDHGA